MQKYSQYTVKRLTAIWSSGRNIDELYKPVSSLFQMAVEDMVTDALVRLQEAH